ncbi:Protein SCO1 homolog 1, mitochondrial [Linum grandiflorum]
MATALARTANRLGKAYQLLNSRHVIGRQFRSPSVIGPRVGSIAPLDTRVPPNPIGQRFMFSSGQTASPAATVSSESAKKVEGAEADGGEEKSGGSEQGGGEAGKSVRGGPVSWLSFILLALTGAGIVYYYDNEKKKHIEVIMECILGINLTSDIAAEINKNSIAVKEGPSAGKAAIGGPFNLVNHEGKKVTEKDFLGKWTVMYFGFTFCPDICPAELEKLVSAVDKIKKKAGFEIVPVFISVDPERDTVDQVREYVKEYHPSLVGLTGTPADIKNVARAYRVYYMKTAEEDYLVDHSIVMYLMSPDMQFVKFFGKNHDDESLTDGIINEIKRYKAQEAKKSAPNQ